MAEARRQTMLVADPEGKLDKTVLRTGEDYCYIVPRLDGTVMLGGIRELDNTCVSFGPFPSFHIRNMRLSS
jgi:D-amino-acid oxidase